MQNLETLISKAIQECGSKNNLINVRNYLSVALQELNNVYKKNKRKKSQEMEDISRKTKQDEWWDMIKKNAIANNPLIDYNE